MKFAVVIVSFPGYVHSQCFEEVAEAVHRGLLELGHVSMRTNDLSSVEPGWRPIVFGSHLLHSSTLFPPGTILYNLEQVGAANVTEDNFRLYGKHALWDYSAANVRKLKELGLDAALVPIGYAETLTRIAPVEEDIDVLFYGAMNQRRADIIQELRYRGANVVALEGIYGAERDAMIARAKLVLNIHYYETSVFESARMVYLLANKKCVLSEDSVDPDFVGGLVFAPYDELVDACRVLLGDEEKRKQIAEKGFEIVRARTMTEDLRAALQSSTSAKTR